MGSEESKPNKPVQPTGEGCPTTINHDSFRNFKYIKGHEGDDNIEIRVPIENEEEYRKWESHLKDCPTEHEFYLMPLQIHLKNEGFCGNTHFLEVLYENFPHILLNEIANRATFEGKKSEFKQPQLWYLLYVLVAAVRDFHLKNKKVGDIRPSNIFINNEGQIKIATYLSFPSQKSNYQKALHDKEVTYLAPEEFKDLQLLKADPGCDSTIAESFSVGLTCLDATILEDSNNLYTKDNMEEGLRRKKNMLKEKNYSQDLIRIINDLCCLSPKNRLSCVEVYEILEPHQKKIMNLQPFQITTKKHQQTQGKIFLFPEQNPPPIAVRQTEVKVSKSNLKNSPVRFTYTSAPSALKQSEKVEPVSIETKTTQIKNPYLTPTKIQNNGDLGQQRTAASPYLASKNHYAYSGSKYSYLNNGDNSVGSSNGTSPIRYSKQPNRETLSKEQESTDLGKIDEQIAASRKMFSA